MKITGFNAMRQG